MARFIFRCPAKDCGMVWAHEYTARRVYAGYGRYDVVYERESAGRKIQSGYDTVCPACSRHARKFGKVQGYVSDHVCDARCTSAKGFQCECSCGGKNHGKDFICEEVQMINSKHDTAPFTLDGDTIPASLLDRATTPSKPVQGALFAMHTDKRSSVAQRHIMPTLMDWLDSNPAK